MDRIVDARDPLPLYGADQTRTFRYIDNAVNDTLWLMALPGREPVVETVGNESEEIVIEALVRRLFAIAGDEAELEIHDLPTGSAEWGRPDLRRLREPTGFEQRAGLDQILRLAYMWCRAEREATLQGIEA